MQQINIFTDGGARGNPGPAAIGVYVCDENRKKIFALGKKIGEATNNTAEYKAVIEALDWLIKNKENIQDNTNINFYLDSQLVYSQIVGLFKVKNENIRSLVFTVREKEAELKKNINYTHIPREKNYNADKLVNLALDNLI